MLSGAPENALAESEGTLLSSRGAWEHLGLLRSTGEGYRSVWEVCVWLPDWFTFRWCCRLFGSPLDLVRNTSARADVAQSDSDFCWGGMTCGVWAVERCHYCRLMSGMQKQRACNVRICTAMILSLRNHFCAQWLVPASLTYMKDFLFMIQIVFIDVRL